MSTTDTSLGLEPPGRDRPSATHRTKWREWIRPVVIELVKLAPVLAILVAVWVATQGQVTVDRSNRATLMQSEDTQLSTAITAMGSSDMARQIAGLLLLARNTSNRLTLMGQTEEAPADVYGDYTTALQILSGYLRSGRDTLLTGNATTAALFGRGYGLPPSSSISPYYICGQPGRVPAGHQYGERGGRAERWRAASDRPSYDELIGQPWTDVNFGWLHAFMVGIDLRGASLESSQWSNNSDLSDSYLQCADLQNANFRGANLSGADLEGAYVQGADFRGANIKGAVFGQLYGKAEWSSRPFGIRTLSAHNWTSAACIQNASFWRGGQTPASTPTALPPRHPVSRRHPSRALAPGNDLELARIGVTRGAVRWLRSTARGCGRRPRRLLRSRRKRSLPVALDESLA